MARAETIESAGETGGSGGGGRGNDPLPHHNCRMEVRCPTHTWPGLLTTSNISSGPGAIHSYHHNHLHPLQPLRLLYSFPHERQSHQQLPARSPSTTPPLSPFNQGEQSDDIGGNSGGISENESDTDVEEHQEISSQREPLPDLLPQNERVSRGSPPDRAPRNEVVQDLEIRRVGSQLRVIGDQFNATVFRRQHPAPFWQDLRDACRGVINFISQTLSTLYRMT